MTPLALVLSPDPILTVRCTPVEAVTPELRELALGMAATLRLAGGAGLAAPQVGLANRLFVVEEPPGSGAVRTYINPTVVRHGRVQEDAREGCLSFPDRPRWVRRYRLIEVRALDLDGLPFTTNARGFLARCLQHELDHLDGQTLFPEDFR